MLKIAPEGYPFIAVFLALTVIALFVFGPGWSAIPLAFALFMVFFFRDPPRTVPPEPGFLSAADGRVVFIGEEQEGEHLRGPSMKISVFMSPLDVHINRSPCDAEVLVVKYTPGSFRAAYRNEASWKNENTAILLRYSESATILVRQVAGFLARRTVCRAEPGETLLRGQRFGMIKFSSRLDHYLPVNAEVKVKLNDRVRAGETVLAVAREQG